ncbi:hypothetical protein [Clostridium thailandense]|nr:hypothetical protein [Clostridium thailandense]
MDENENHMTKEELEEKLQAELEWVKYRLRMLDIMEKKLYQMRDVAQKSAKNISAEERNDLNKKIKWLEMQVNALDEESRHE